MVESRLVRPVQVRVKRRSKKGVMEERSIEGKRERWRDKKAART